MTAIKLALLPAATTGVQVGVAIAASRFVVAEIPPLTLAQLRYAIGFACLQPSIFKSFKAPALDGRAQAAIKNIAISDWLAMVALGAGQFALLIALLNYGLQHIGAAQAALIFSLFPLPTLLMSSALGRSPQPCWACFLGEDWGAWLLAALVLIAAGLWLATRLRRPRQ